MSRYRSSEKTPSPNQLGSTQVVSNWAGHLGRINWPSPMSSVRRDEFGEPVISTPGLMIHVSDMTVSHSLGWHLNRRIFSNLAATYRGRVPFFSEEPIVFSQVYFREPTNIAWGMSTDDAANKVGMIHLGPIRLRFWDQDGLDCWQSLWRIFDHTPGHWHGNPCNCHQDLWTNH